MSWADCFGGAPDSVSIEEVQAALADRRAATSQDDVHETEATDGSAGATDESAASTEVSEPPDPSPTRIVADADVLAADCCVGGTARDVCEALYRHSWTTLVASDELLADAEAVIETVAGESVAADWREAIEAWREPVGQPAGDHPALASAYRGGAMHVLSFDEELTASGTGAALHERFPVSVRQPDAFALLFDPERLYESEQSGGYPGPDREPRA